MHQSLLVRQVEGVAHPMDEMTQHELSSAMAAYGPQLNQSDADYAYGLQQQMQLHRDREVEEWYGRGIFPPAYASSPAPTPVPAEHASDSGWPDPPRPKPAEGTSRRLDDQEDAYHYLLDTLSSDQRDALLCPAIRSKAHGLDQLLDALDALDDDSD